MGVHICTTRFVPERSTISEVRHPTGKTVRKNNGKTRASVKALNRSIGLIRKPALMTSGATQESDGLGLAFRFLPAESYPHRASWEPCQPGEM